MELQLITMQEILTPSVFELVLLLFLLGAAGYGLLKLAKLRFSNRISYVLMILGILLLLPLEGYSFSKFKLFLLDVARDYQSNAGRIMSRARENSENSEADIAVSAKEAADIMETALTLYRIAGAKTLQVMAMSPAAGYHIISGNKERQIELILRANRLHKEVNLTTQHGENYQTIANIAADDGNPDEARKYYILYIETMESSNIQILETRAWHEYARFEEDQKNYDAARDAYHTAITIISELAELQRRSGKEQLTFDDPLNPMNIHFNTYDAVEEHNYLIQSAGQLEIDAGNLDAAVRLFEQNKNTGTYDQLMETLISLSKAEHMMDKAGDRHTYLEQFETASRNRVVEPVRYSWFSQMAELELEFGHIEKVKPLYQAAVAEQTQSYESTFELAQQEIERYGTASYQNLNWKFSGKSLAALHVSIAEFENKHGDPASADEHLQSAITLYQKHEYTEEAEELRKRLN